MGTPIAGIGGSITSVTSITSNGTGIHSIVVVVVIADNAITASSWTCVPRTSKRHRKG